MPVSGLLLDGTQTPSRANVCVTGYNSKKPNFALSNFYDNEGKGFWFKDPDLAGPIWFPTSEHYLHFQKLTAVAKKAIVDNAAKLQTWQLANPKEILSAFQKNTATPPKIAGSTTLGVADSGLRYQSPNDWLQWDQNDKIMTQLQINETKYQQSQAFRESIQFAIELGKGLDNGGPVCIIEDTASADHEEKIWGSGPDGKGTNLLGITQTATAAMVKDGKILIPSSFVPDRNKPPIALPTCPPTSTSTSSHAQAYVKARSEYEQVVQPILITARQKATPPKTDTSDVNNVTIIQDVAHLQKLKTPKPPASTNTAVVAKGDVSFIVTEFKKAFPMGSGGLVETKNNQTFLSFPSKDGKSPDEVAVNFCTELTKKTTTPFLMQKYVDGVPEDHYLFFSGKGELIQGNKKDIETKLQASGDTAALKLFQSASKPTATTYRDTLAEASQSTLPPPPPMPMPRR